MAGSWPAGNSMSTTGPVICTTWPTPVGFVWGWAGVAIAMFGVPSRFVDFDSCGCALAAGDTHATWPGRGQVVARSALTRLACEPGDSQRAWAPVAISIISRVMFAWRTL